MTLTTWLVGENPLFIKSQPERLEYYYNAFRQCFFFLFFFLISFSLKFFRNFQRRVFPKCLSNYLIHSRYCTKFLYKIFKHCLEQFPSSFRNMSTQSLRVDLLYRWYPSSNFVPSLKHCWKTFVSVLKLDCEQTHWPTCSQSYISSGVFKEYKNFYIGKVSVKEFCTVLVLYKKFCNIHKKTSA